MMKRTMLIAAVCFLAACSAPVERMSEKMVRSQMERCPQATYLDFNEGKFKWNYTPGLELKAFLDVWKAYGDGTVLDYVKGWYDLAVNEDGSINTYSVDKYSTDHICPGVALFTLYEATGEEKYRKAMDLLMTQIKGQPRTSEGAFWHKAAYPHQLWLDGVYMSGPFYAGYAQRFLEGAERKAAFEEIANEFLVAAEHTFDPATGLYRHAWDESRSMPWCDPQTGQSKHCWGRALGWYCMALVDVLEIIDKDVEGRDRMVEILNGICTELPRWADPESGVWYQVLDQPGREGNYLEATCSAMFAYTLLKGVRLGLLSPDLKDCAIRTYRNVVDSFITIDEAGLISIEQCCAVGGLGGKQNRMGDFEYYLSEPVRANDSKGTGPFIWASLEMERL